MQFPTCAAVATGDFIARMSLQKTGQAQSHIVQRLYGVRGPRQATPAVQLWLPTVAKIEVQLHDKAEGWMLMPALAQQMPCLSHSMTRPLARHTWLSCRQIAIDGLLAPLATAHELAFYNRP